MPQPHLVQRAYACDICHIQQVQWECVLLLSTLHALLAILKAVVYSSRYATNRNRDRAVDAGTVTRQEIDESFP